MKTETTLATERNYVLRAHISPDPEQPRKHFDQVKLEELAASFGGTAEGIGQDLLVRADPKKEGRFILVDGERRWRGAELVGIERVPVRVVSDEEAKRILAMQIVLNQQHENMTALETAAGAQRLLEEERAKDPKFGVTELGARLGLKRAATYELLSLLKLSPALNQALTAGEISPSIAARIAAVPIPEAQTDILEWYRGVSQYSPAPSVRDVQDYIEGNCCKKLDDAPFNLEGMYEGKRIVAFTCMDCPHRSGNQPNWPSGKDTHVCLRPECYRAKALAHAELEGKEVVSAKVFEAKRNDYVLPGERVGTFSHGHQEAKKLLGKVKPKALVTTDSVGDLIELWGMKEFRELAEKEGVVFDKPKAEKPKAESKKQKAEMTEAEKEEFFEQQRKAEKEREKARKEDERLQREREENAAKEQLREKVVEVVLPILREKLAKASEKDVLIFALQAPGLRGDMHDVMRERKLKALDKCDVGQLRSLMCEVTLRADAGSHMTTGDDYDEQFKDVCKIGGIDLKAEEKKLAPKEEKATQAELLPAKGKASAKKKGSKKK